MRIEIVELHDGHIEPRLKMRRIVISHLHDDHDRPGHQCPTAKRQSQTLNNTEIPDGWNGGTTPDRDAPTMLATVQVDGDDAAERRLEQWQSSLPPRELAAADKVVGGLGRFGLEDRR